MAVLSEVQRRSLEKAVERAREVAEAGARAAIRHLGVQTSEQLPHLSPEERDLRNRLRARARQLGDTRNAKTGEHGVDHLVVECAYEHWHRMLFARFLAENNVLMHPDGVPVTLDECEELAPDAGAADGWELAAWYAAEMLPQIFRPGSPVFELKLPPEKVRELERLLADLSPAVFAASDSLGWVYQFWQAKKKEEVNDSEVKIGADELPAVTQLFTEPYMVHFLLHNTLGAWWVGRHGRDSLPVEMPYLRSLENGTPAAGGFPEWPDSAARIRILDPSCGSGHFLVSAFEILVRFRIAEEELGPADACDAVLRDNLHGLEIDERCTQIAAFALALAAWTFPRGGGYRPLPEMQIACSGLAPRARQNEWIDLAGDDDALRNGMRRLFSLFQDAPLLGSLIDPERAGLSGQQRELGVAPFVQLSPLLTAQLSLESPVVDDEKVELGVTAKGIATAAGLLAAKYELVATNVPYLARGKQSSRLQGFCDLHFDEAKRDLATVFLDRLIRLTAAGCTAAVVVPQNWTFLATYKRFRKRLLREHSWGFFAKLGPGAFETISGEVVNVGLLAISNMPPATEHRFLGLDATSQSSPRSKAEALITADAAVFSQSEQIKNPDSRVVLEALERGAMLSAYADSYQGLKSGDDGRWRRYFWEVDVGDRWKRMQSTVATTIPVGGMESVIDWVDDGAHMARRQGLGAWGRRGVAVSQMSSLSCALYFGDSFDSNVCPVVPKDAAHLPALWAFCESGEFQSAVRRIDQKMAVANATMVKVPFDLEKWQEVARVRYPHGLSQPRSDDPTQWLFPGSVRASTMPLQVAAARLLGYRWPDQVVDDSLDEHIDDDGIVCLPAVRGEQPAASRLQRVLSVAFGDAWSAHKQAEILAAVGCRGWTLERWLSERFFQQHCKVFQNRPFIWHIWDGLKRGGFGVLVSYHALDRKLLETLTYNYLGDWVRRQHDGTKRGEDGADDRLAAAHGLQNKLKMILEGERPLDIFVRWKPIEQQPVGWEPDTNDGVRVNIRPFMLVGDVGKRGAGVLRDKPNVSWGKDRGKDPADAPWFDEFGGDRINDHHLTLAEKKAARDGAGGGA